MRYAYDQSASRPSVDIHSIAESIQLSNVSEPRPDKLTDLFGYLNEAYNERQSILEKVSWNSIADI